MINKAIEILQKTNDGDDLTKFELKIVEMAVNNHLNEKGKKKFEEIYQKYV
jgi:hypothetical protein